MLWRCCRNVEATSWQSWRATWRCHNVGNWRRYNSYFRPCHNVVTTSTTMLSQRCHNVTVPAGLRITNTFNPWNPQYFLKINFFMITFFQKPNRGGLQPSKKLWCQETTAIKWVKYIFNKYVSRMLIFMLVP